MPYFLLQLFVDLFAFMVVVLKIQISFFLLTSAIFSKWADLFFPVSLRFEKLFLPTQPSCVILERFKVLGQMFKFTLIAVNLMKELLLSPFALFYMSSIFIELLVFFGEVLIHLIIGIFQLSQKSLESNSFSSLILQCHLKFII